MNMMNKAPTAEAAGYGSLGSAPRGLADIIGITALTQVLRRRLRLVLAIGGAALLITFIALMLQPARYTATTLLIVTPRNASSEAAAVQADVVDSEIELLRSPALLDDLAQSLGLVARTEGRPAPGAGLTEDMAIDLTSAIDIKRRGATNVVEIRGSSGSAERAQLMANTYADVYLGSQLNAFVDGTQQTSAFAAQRLAELREDAQAKQSAADAFRAEAGINPEGDVNEIQVDSLQAQISQAQADLEQRQARYRQVQELRNSGATPDDIANTLGSAAITQLRERQADISRRQTDLETRYFPSHPDVQAVRAERADVDAQLEREVQRASVDGANQVAAARSRLQSLQEALRGMAATTPSDGNASERLQELEREATESREIYESFLERQRATMDGARSGADARILSYANLPSAPSSPQLRIALALALLAAFGFGIGSALIIELFDKSVKNADDLEAKVGYKAIASIPTISKRMMRQMPPAERHPSGYLVGRPMSAFTEALRVLRTVIVYSKLDFSVKVVAITSALPNEGKTTISMCLARVAAMSGQKVCVVDCDLRMQSINDVIDIETDVGILQVLAGEAPWRSAIVRDPNSDAHILPVATAGFTPRDVFGSDAMARLIGDLRGAYDLVILDCAPILAVAETRILVQQADTTVLVARAGRTPIGAMRAAVAQTHAAEGNVLGIALNYVLPHWQTYTDSLYFDQSKSYYSVS